MESKFKPLFLFSCAIVIACQSDTIAPRVSEDKLSNEEKYMKDYESPTLKWGFINQYNELIISAKYDDLRDFSESYAPANYRGKWGIIDKNEEVFLDFNYRAIKEFNNGIAFAQDFDFNWFMVDKQAKLTPITSHKIGDFNPSMMCQLKNEFWGIVDYNGIEKLPFKYEKIKIDTLNIYLKKDKKWSIANLDGALLSQSSYDAIYGMKSGLIRFKADGLYGFLNTNGKVVIKAQYDKALDFETANTFVKKGEQYILINQSGKRIKEFKAKKIISLSEGYFGYKLDDSWGILDNNGHQLTEDKYFLLNKYSDGKITFAIDTDHWGYLDHQGKEIIAPIYPITWDFNSDLAKFIAPTGIGFINSEEKTIIPPIYNEAKDFKEGLARVQVY